MGRKACLEKGRKARRNAGKGLRIHHVRCRFDFQGKASAIDIGTIGQVEAVAGAIGQNLTRNPATCKLRRAEWQHINQRREEKAASTDEAAVGGNLFDAIAPVQPVLFQHVHIAP